MLKENQRPANQKITKNYLRKDRKLSRIITNIQSHLNQNLKNITKVKRKQKTHIFPDKINK